MDSNGSGLRPAGCTRNHSYVYWCVAPPVDVFVCKCALVFVCKCAGTLHFSSSTHMCTSIHILEVGKTGEESVPACESRIALLQPSLVILREPSGLPVVPKVQKAE